MAKKPKTILVITYGPVPTPEYQTVEGGGMRCWGLAEGLHANGHDVTVAVNSGFPQKPTEHQSIKLINWQLDPTFAETVNSFDVVIMSYCMGDLSVFVADNISPKVTLVLDCYVPIYIEVSARHATDMAEEYRNYFADIQRFNHVLRRGDYFLCANEPQKHMYMGILGSLGVINPRSYSEGRVLEVPFGISQPGKAASKTSPYAKLGITESDFTLLWFGALYPWFNFSPLLDAVEQLAKSNPKFKFVLVGGKNPFNNHPDFVSQYEMVKQELTKRRLLGQSCHMVDWVDFDKRIDWYAGAQAVISINREGDENIFSWRTRVMDYVWGSLPMLTNGTDPLSEYLIAEGAALRIETNTESITSAITSLMQDAGSFDQIKTHLSRVQQAFLWPKVTAPLAEAVIKSPLPYDEERIYAISIGFDTPPSVIASIDSTVTEGTVGKINRYLRKAREKGWRRTAGFAFGVLRAKATHTLKPSLPGKPKAVLLSHPIDDTGAPLVLLDLAKDISSKFGARNVHIAAPNAEKHLLSAIRAAGFTYHKVAEGVGDRIINAQLNVQKDDFVLMNTVALHESYKQYIYRLLEHDKLNKAVWFIHEDKPEIRLQNLGEVARIRHLMNQNKLEIIVPSQQTASEYNKFLQTDQVRPVKLRVEVPEKLIPKRTSQDFSTLRFVISGTPSDGRKGQLLFLAALEAAVAKLKAQKVKLREFEIHFISIGDDYVSQQIKAVGEGLFDQSFHHYPKVPKDDAMAITAKGNVTVCTSLNETFALFVAEGMLLGHVILRNNTSGWQEQIKDGVNGYLVDNLDLKSLAGRLELLLNPKTLTNEQLLKMSQESQKIAAGFKNANYAKQILK